MMDKRVHSRNAFSYSCFGAKAVKAKRKERKEDRWGFSLVGNDGSGKRHKQATGYYVSDITIPPVVPDGHYVFGWAWFGGTGGSVSNKSYKKEPFWKGYFTDYWSCSFVQVRGGKPLERKYTPVFKNDMKQFSREGCMSANDALGICTREPCIVYGKYQKPKPFKRAGGPEPLTPAHFSSNAITGKSGGRDPLEPPEFVLPKSPKAPPAPRRNFKIDPLKRKKYACRCIVDGERCGKKTARISGYCKRWVAPEDQPRRCVRSCCALCKLGAQETAKLCITLKVRTACKL